MSKLKKIFTAVTIILMPSGVIALEYKKPPFDTKKLKIKVLSRKVFRLLAGCCALLLALTNESDLTS